MTLHNISGAAVLAAGVALVLLPPQANAREHKEKVLYSFTAGNDGYAPQAGLIADAQGNLYGTASGGSPDCGEYGCGEVFKLTPAGDETVLHTFVGGSDGFSPSGGLIADAEGNLYGATAQGGNACFGGGCGTVFKLTPQGKETVLYAFTGGSDGGGPVGSLIADADGNLYGATGYGGIDDNGTVFKLTPKGKETVLYAFKGGSDGIGPYAGLIADPDGNLFGTTAYGGNFDCDGIGCGTVFELTPEGQETVLYAFAGGSDGANPEASLIADGEGNLYGTTYGGGVDCGGSGHGCGTAFKLTPSGKETVLHAFAGGSDGTDPKAGLIADVEGNLYGTTSRGGVDCDGGGLGCGTVFKLTPKGKETVLYTFTGKDGANPYAGLIADAKGNLYGTTLNGGRVSLGWGTVFKMKN